MQTPHNAPTNQQSVPQLAITDPVEQEAQITVNPFSQNGLICASDLDYEHGFPGMFLSSTDAKDISRFRVDITSFWRDSSLTEVKFSQKRTINNASSLFTALRDGSIPCPSRQSRYRSGNLSARRASSQAIPNSVRRITIITIPQDFSGGPLKITRTALQDLIRQLDLPATFLPVVYAFGSVPRISEAGLDCYSEIRDPNDAASFTLCYLFRFKDRDQDDSVTMPRWKDRQIGMLHRRCVSTGHDLFVVLQPHPNSMFDGAVEYDVQTSGEGMATLMQNTLYMHQLLISTYFGRWREYMRDVADDFARCSAHALSQDLVKDYNLDFDFLQRWRNTMDNVAPIGAALHSTIRIINGLRELQQRSVEHGAVESSLDLDIFLGATKSQAEGLHQSALALEKRIANIAELMTNTIESKNQFDAARLNRHMERLTLDTVDDSTSVKTITYLTLIYLPGSFVASLFGMNLFGFDSSNRMITIARNFWLYIVMFIPLTAITFAGAWLLSDRAKKRRDERNKLLDELLVH